ncbi:MAG: replication-associated recombination protein A [Actinomycetaceae bacterium]|nr:replication-associated recombination protein A [Actinomycetaceae bacterium]
MDLFESASVDDNGLPRITPQSPLAMRMRPRSLKEVIGQEKILAPGSPLYNFVHPSSSKQRVNSVFLWGAPGSGKTSIAYLAAQDSHRHFEEISAVSSGVKELRYAIEASKRRLQQGKETIVFIDEVHRFSKTQQDALLPAVENGWIRLIAATTENPSFSVIAPLLSRSILVVLNELTPDALSSIIHKTLKDPRGFNNEYTLESNAEEHIIRLSGTDARQCLTILEATSIAAEERSSSVMTVEDVRQAVTSAHIAYDKSGDQHYWTISAFIKSIRGSHVDAALHYLARMLEAGEDPRFIARRLMISAAEDIGMADPSALQTATAAAQSVSIVGMPEAQIILAQATVHLATAPKSNRSYMALNAAIKDVRKGNYGSVPLHLRNDSFKGASDLGYKQGYKYAHDYPDGVAPMSFMPEKLEGKRYYEPTQRGYEGNITPRLKAIRSILDEKN